MNTKLKLLIVFISIFAGFGCAKKDNSKQQSSRLNPSAGASGARTANPGGSQSALDLAQAQGITSLHFDYVRPPQVISGTYLQVSSSLVFNNASLSLETYHGYSNDPFLYSTVMTTSSGGFTLEAQGVCLGNPCATYYTVISVYRGNAEVIQMIEKTNFQGGTNTSRNYQSPGGFVGTMDQVVRILGQ